jgi:hypothetical protein
MRRLKALTRRIKKVLAKKRQIRWSWLVAALLITAAVYHFHSDWEFKQTTKQTFSLLEGRFGGQSKLGCDPQLLRQNTVPSVVRIIGSKGEGTGFAISEHEIMTSHHVVDDEASPKVVYPDSTIELPTTMRGLKDLDIAIITVKRSLTPLEFIPAAEPFMQFGEAVFSIGYPYGSFLPGAPLISQGWYEGSRIIPDWIPVPVVQTSMTIIEGMSGGPLVDSCGQVVGVNTSGQPGLSIFVAATEVRTRRYMLKNMEIGKIEVDPFTAEGVVRGFYELMNAERWSEAYLLLHPSRRIISLEQWVEGYINTLHVNVIKAQADDLTVNVKLRANDWVNGYLETKFFEGTWTVAFAGDVYNLVESNIKEIEPPNRWWYWE